MGVYIPNMGKPKTCDDCIVPLSKCDFLQRRADECLLIEIPASHGRLIEEFYPGELKAKQPKELFIIYRSADEDSNRFMLEAEGGK